VKKELFTKESLEEFSKLEQAANYNKTASPRISLLFIGIIIFLVAFVLWAFWGEVDLTLKVYGVSSDNTLSIMSEDLDQRILLTSAKEIKFDVYKIDTFDVLIQYDETYGDLGITLYTDNSGMPDGVYEGYAVIGTCSPAALVFGDAIESALEEISGSPIILNEN